MNEKNKATLRRRLKDDVRLGHVTRSSYCEVCYEVKQVEAHHPNFDEPHRYVWVCKNCHTKILDMRFIKGSTIQQKVLK